VQRFKDCRKAAEEKKNNVEEHKLNSPQSNEDDEEDEDDESGDEEGSEGSSDNTSDENIEAQQANRKIRDYQEYETAIDSIILAKSKFSRKGINDLLLKM
jgi:cobalamin biosynthesis protein CobT